MASTRAFLALALVALALIAIVEAARELRGAQDTVITNCRNYGWNNGKRVCTQCVDDNDLLPGGWECAKRISGCRSYGIFNNRRVCTSCHDDHALIPGGWECHRRTSWRPPILGH